MHSTGDARIDTLVIVMSAYVSITVGNLAVLLLATTLRWPL